jgi:hypothetical protein
MMRHWRVGSIAPLEGLDPEILALYGDDEPARLEEASWDAAGAAYAYRHSRDAMATLCAQLASQYTDVAVAPTQFASVSDSDSDPAPARRKARLLEDRITDALKAAESPLTAEQVLDAVLADGGKEVKLGSVRNTLSGLADDGEATRAGHGLYAAPGATP